MKDISELRFPEECRYIAEHVWIRQDGDEWLIGISDYAQDQLGEIAFVDLPAVGASFEAGQEFGSVESIKSVNALFMPVNGTVEAVNEELEGAPTLINVSPYEKGWMLRIRATSPDAVAGLLTAEAYRAQLG